MGEVGLAVGVMRPLLVAALAVVMVACGGQAEAPVIGAGEVRVLVTADGPDAVVVALEGRDVAGDWTVRIDPDDATISELATDQWRWSSTVRLAAPGSIAIAAVDGQFQVEPAAGEIASECGIVAASASGGGDAIARLQLQVLQGDACDRWSEPIDASTAAEIIEMQVRIGARSQGTCLEIRIEVRAEGALARELRPVIVCGVTAEAGPNAAPPMILPYHNTAGAIEVRSVGGGLSAGFDGRLLSTACDEVVLELGLRTIWQHRFDAETCEWSYLERIVELEDAPRNEEILDGQQFAVYDWARDVEANFLPVHWSVPDLDLARAAAIVEAVYVDYFGTAAGAPRVVMASAEDDYPGAYFPDAHEIQLRADGMTVSVVLHEAAHAMLRLALSGDDGYYLDPQHGPEFVAHLLSVWQRYDESFDFEVALDLAPIYRVRVFEAEPLSPRGSTETRSAVTSRLAPR